VITCLSASVAGSDFCCRKSGSLTICFTILHHSSTGSYLPGYFANSDYLIAMNTGFMISSAICHSIYLEQESVRSADMCKFGLYRLTYRIITIETLFYDFLHNRNIPYISKKAVHLNNILKRKIK
jgi:hypothetical protein